MPPQEQEIRTTTMSVSRTFATIVTVLARSESMTVREWCDKYLAPGLKAKAKRAIKRSLEAIDLSGES